MFIHNDPYDGGSHLPDVNVVAPAFHDGRLLGFGCVRAHWPDIGSATPGSYGAVTEIYGEGLRLPPIRLYRDGKPDPSVEAIIFANVRTPAERLGDLRAQVAANLRAAQRLGELAAKYGTDTLLGIMQEVLDYSETMMRAALRALPDGEAEFTDIFDGDGVLGPGRNRGRDLQGSHQGGQARRHHHRRFHRVGPGGGRADERAADGDGVRRVLRAEDDRRPEKPDPAELRLLAAGDGDGAAGVAWSMRSIRRRWSTPTTRFRTASPTW